MAQTKATVLILQHFFISRKNHKASVEFAKMHFVTPPNEESRKILSSDKSKFDLKESDSKRKCVRRPPNKRLSKYYKGMVNHGGGNVIVWGCSPLNRIGHLYEISETMDKIFWKLPCCRLQKMKCLTDSTDRVG